MNSWPRPTTGWARHPQPAGDGVTVVDDRVAAVKRAVRTDLWRSGVAFFRCNMCLDTICRDIP
jgi:hypothetical protein